MQASLSVHPSATTPSPIDPPLQQLQLPGIEQRLRYTAQATAALLSGWLRPHGLISSTEGHYCADFRLTPALRRQWHGFFRTDATREIPYLFHTSAAHLLASRLLADLGLNLRHVRPLQQVVQHQRHADPLGQVPHQRLSCRLLRIVPLASEAVAVQLRTRISSHDGQLLATQEDTLAVRHVDTAGAPGLQHDRSIAACYAQLRDRRARLDHGEANVGEWVVGADWGRQFAKVSGLLSPAHGARLSAWMLGLRAPTLPSACLRDLLVRQLADIGLRAERLDISFCRPVYLNQRLTIAQRDAEFEITDARGVLMAFGTC